MDIQEEDNDSSQKTQSTSNSKTLSLRKKKPAKQHLFKDSSISSNDILDGEIILKNEQIEFIHKKRYRLTNIDEIIKNESNKKYKDDEEEQLSSKIIEIYNKLQVQTSHEIKEGEYNAEYHDKKEKIVTKLLKDTKMFDDIRRLATKTKNVDIYCTALDIFNDFCYYNNQFMVDSHEYLEGIVNNSFTFDDKFKSISLSIKFCYSVIDFGFFDEYREKFIDYFVGLVLDDKKNNDLNSVQGAKTYYPEQTEEIILLINTLCDNILYPKIFQKKDINYEIAKEINKYMFELISVILKNIPPNEMDQIIKVQSINYIIRQTFNVIIKIISGVNLIKENDTSIQELLVPPKEKQLIFEFIMFFSQLNLDEKNFLWLADIMAKFAEITYYSDIYDV